MRSAWQPETWHSIEAEGERKEPFAFRGIRRRAGTPRERGLAATEIAYAGDEQSAPRENDEAMQATRQVIGDRRVGYGRARSRCSPRMPRGVHPPGSLYRCQKKRDAGKGVCMYVKTKGRKFQHGQHRGTQSSETAQLDCFAAGKGLRARPSGGTLSILTIHV